MYNKTDLCSAVQVENLMEVMKCAFMQLLLFQDGYLLFYPEGFLDFLYYLDIFGWLFVFLITSGYCWSLAVNQRKLQQEESLQVPGWYEELTGNGKIKTVAMVVGER